MAGIGFELKKLFKNKGFIFDLRAFAYASLVTVGPQLLCLLMITLMQLLLIFLKIPDFERQLFLASTMYAFIFSQIITSGFSMVITRYISDKLYAKEYGKVLPSLYGVISICLLIGAIFGVSFFYSSPINIFVKISAYLLFMELIIMWLLYVYLSALKDYLKIVKSFLIGIVTGIALGFFLLMKTKINASLALLWSVDIGIFIIVALLMFYIKSFFKSSENKYFEFLKYLDKYYSLFLICVFYTLSLFGHNFIFWGSHLSVNVFFTYWYAPVYDVPTFYAFLTILPSAVLFVVFIETSFYDKYKEYYSLIVYGGNLKAILSAKKIMIKVLWQEIFYLMEKQLFFTIIFILLGNYFLPQLGLNEESVYIFYILALAAYCTISMQIIVLIHLYFDNRKGALKITTLFLLSNIIFTLISIKLGYNYYGFGYFLSSLLSLIVGISDLSTFLKKIDYVTFCSQPIMEVEKIGFFTKLVDKIYK